MWSTWIEFCLFKVLNLMWVSPAIRAHPNVCTFLDCWLRLRIDHAVDAVLFCIIQKFIDVLVWVGHSELRGGSNNTQIWILRSRMYRTHRNTLGSPNEKRTSDRTYMNLAVFAIVDKNLDNSVNFLDGHGIPVPCNHKCTLHNFQGLKSESPNHLFFREPSQVVPLSCSQKENRVCSTSSSYQSVPKLFLNYSNIQMLRIRT